MHYIERCAILCMHLTCTAMLYVYRFITVKNLFRPFVLHHDVILINIGITSKYFSLGQHLLIPCFLSPAENLASEAGGYY